MHTLTLKLEDEYRLLPQPPSAPDDIDHWLREFPKAWAETGGIGLAEHRPPIFVEIKLGAEPVQVRQYPMSQEAKEGITPRIRHLLDLGILRPCRSAWNTPLLLARKPSSNDYRPVQDLREVNKRVTDIHSTVPNPYTLLSSLPPNHIWYTVLDLKEAFFQLAASPKESGLICLRMGRPGMRSTWTTDLDSTASRI